MKRKNSVWAQIIFIFVIGLIVSSLNGSFNLSALFSGSDGRDIKSLLDSLSMILAGLALILGTGYLFYRAAQGEKDRKSDKWDQ